MAKAFTEAVAEATSASLGGGTATALLYPLDTARSIQAAVMKTRAGERTLGVSDRIQQDGVMILYKGLSVKLFKSMLGKYLYFFAYTWLKSFYANNVGPVTAVPSLLCGYVAEWSHVPVTQPADILVTRLQAGKGRRLMDTISDLYNEGGLGAFFRGLAAQPVLCLQPAIQFTIWDNLKRIYFSNTELSVGAAFRLGAFSRCVALCIIYPYLRAKTVLQTRKKEGKDQGNDILPVLRDIYRIDGFAGMYAGLLPELLRGVLSSALMMVLKEKIQAFTKGIIVRK